MTVGRHESVHRPRYFRFCNVCIYGQSGPSLLIESTDSMILLLLISACVNFIYRMLRAIFREKE